MNEKEELKREIKELEIRLKNDENAWIKIRESANRQHIDSLNQLADLFRMVDRLVTKLNKIETKLNEKPRN